MPRVLGVAPFFLVADVRKAAEYYRDKLGFTIIGYFFEEPPVFAMVGRDDKIVMLSLAQGTRGDRTAATRARRSMAISGSTTPTRFMASSSKAAPTSSPRRNCGSTA